MARNSADIDDERTDGPTPTRSGSGRTHARPRPAEPDPAPRAGGGGLERLTVNLIPRASKALEHACSLTGDSKTDTINRAVQVYAYLEDVWAKDGAVLVKSGDAMTELKFF